MKVVGILKPGQFWSARALSLHGLRLPLLHWVGRRVARQAGASVFVSLSLGAFCLWWLLRLDLVPDYSARTFALGALIVVPAATLCAIWVTSRLLGDRLAYLTRVIDQTGPHAELARIRDLGSDEVGAIAQAVNRLLARLTSIHASMIDQQRELGEAQRELKLKAELAEKTRELTQRLEERATLFEILRMTSSSPELGTVLSTLVERVGQLLQMREVVLFLCDEETQQLNVEAAFGLDVGAIRGRSQPLGEGPSGRAGSTRAPVVIDDLAGVAEFQGFWGQAERSGSLAAVPISYQGTLLGVLTGTREQGAIGELQVKLLCAIADNAALAIRNAQLFERMRLLSTHDELTGLANRRLLRTYLDREVERARRFHKALSLLVIDIDHFKLLNDRHGHPVGDAALRETAKLLTSNVRKVDLVARVGGEEFMVLLPRAGAQAAELVAEKLRAAFAQHPFAGREDQPSGALTISVGVSELCAEDDEHGDSLVARADLALYAAKRAGRDRVFIQAPPGRAEAQ